MQYIYSPTKADDGTHESCIKYSRAGIRSIIVRLSYTVSLVFSKIFALVNAGLVYVNLIFKAEVYPAVAAALVFGLLP